MPGKVFLLMIVLVCSSKLHAQPNARECQDMIERGYHYLYRFRPAEAMERFQTAIDLAKELKSESLYAKALFGAGQATWYAGNFHQAADTVKLALQHFPKNDGLEIVGALRILSNIYDDIGDYENALKAVQEALDVNRVKDKQNKILSLV